MDAQVPYIICVVFASIACYILPYTWFKSSLDDLQQLIQCKCYTDSCRCMTDSTFAFWNFLEIKKIWSDIDWIHGCGTMDMKGRLYCLLAHENWIRCPLVDTQKSGALDTENSKVERCFHRVYQSVCQGGAPRRGINWSPKHESVRLVTPEDVREDLDSFVIFILYVIKRRTGK